MQKILSICIPSFNMEAYLRRCLDSLIVPSLGKLEIIIVNDGSTDRTLEIAKEYESMCPESFIVLDKSNGHYGSTVNAALKIATGKYFRILDADDWFDSDVLEYMIGQLDALDVDCIYTKFTKHDFYKNTVAVKEISGISYGCIIDLSVSLLPDEVFSMHSLTYRLSCLKEIAYYQTEGICYTDIEYVLYPLSKIKTFYAINRSLYQYFIGRDDQSVSFQSLQKTSGHRLKIVRRIVTEYKACEGNLNARNIVRNVLLSLMRGVLRMYILHMRPVEELDKDIFEVYDSINAYDGGAYDMISNLKVLFVVPYVKIWRKYRTDSFYVLTPVRWVLRMINMK